MAIEALAMARVDCASYKLDRSKEMTKSQQLCPESIVDDWSKRDVLCIDVTLSGDEKEMKAQLVAWAKAVASYAYSFSLGLRHLVIYHGNSVEEIFQILLSARILPLAVYSPKVEQIFLQSLLFCNLSLHLLQPSKRDDLGSKTEIEDWGTLPMLVMGY
ncbi:hypothetical protein AMTR_s00164p00070670 [Amborella trichopoda]|uniref:Uncharacterized protein n=1 Tax=Amborella trichopoda TaxID=13333 RepID=W1PSA8_AMBTC|nr:hypothetical protein AMTR_s00164p00070670 [Amborella trichopoda]